MRAFRLAYDGTGYRGFQRQPHGETVEDTLFESLAALDVRFEAEKPVGYAAAGRTDAGVSARAQTVAFDAPAWLTPGALNSELPGDVRAWAAADAPKGFHATYDAVERVYRYFLYAVGVDDERIRSACEKVTGAHDFHNLTPDDRGTERELSVTGERRGEFVVIDCRADGFARQLVRRLVSLVEGVGRGERSVDFIDRALSPEPLDGEVGIAPAAPEPLVLLDVRYPALSFSIDEVAAERAKAVFDARRRERLASVRVADALCALDEP